MGVITILGAGPAGCELARRLSATYEVVLVDRNTFPRNKPCGGILIEESVDFIKELSPPAEVYSNPKELDLIYKDLDNKLEFKQKRGFCNVSRKEFDYWLFKLATARANVKFVRGNVTKVVSGKKFLIKLKNNGKIITLKSDIVVDASGAYSLLRKLSFPRKDIYMGIQFELKKDERFKEFYYVFLDSLSDYYSWIIPKKDSLLVGSCFNKGKTLVSIEKMKSAFSKEFNINFTGGQLQAAPIVRPLKLGDVQLIKDDFFIIGEAAGLVSPSTGEGISYALRSAKACADAINDSTSLLESKKKYLINAEYLVNEIKEKIGRANLFTGANARVHFFKDLQP